MENFDRAIRVITAIAAVSIALKLWLAPTPVTHADFIALKEMRDRGVADEIIKATRKEIHSRTPHVYVSGGSLSVDSY